MKLTKLFFLPVFLLATVAQSGAQADEFLLHGREGTADILYQAGGHPLYATVAGMLAEDIERVTGSRPEFVHDPADARGNLIVLGGIESEPVRQFAGDGFASDIRGKWETFGLIVLNRKETREGKVLLIAGSDPRGTAYGVVYLAEKIGVSPWYWWADVHPEKKAELAIRQEKFISSPPSVRYRGIFLNDEDWGLQPWAARTFDPKTGDIGPPTYKKIFELLLRLRANFIWPAMHNCTRAFFSYPGNVELAKKYGIVLGSSHAEPMLRNNVDEWDEEKNGEFNFRTNQEGVLSYWRDRVEQSRGVEAVYTVGMRGIHDSGMRGFGDMDSRASAMEEIIARQREMLSACLDREPESVPQAFIPYKEVLAIYDHGMDLPGDITLVWTDDNYGYIRRLSDEKERQRPGGSGVYYHVSYWGRPHDYLWLSSIHPALIREEMTKAWESGARKIWVLNVGDIKPAEYPVQLFLDMAWNIDGFRDGTGLWEHHRAWAEEVFPGSGEDITQACRTYYDLAFRRKPEFTGWNQVEKQTVVSASGFNHFYYGDEAGKRLEQYYRLLDKTRQIRRQVPGYRKDAFFQLVRYPLQCAAWMNIKWLSLEKAYLYAKQGRVSAGEYARQASSAYDSLRSLTEFYNEFLSDGKWEGMMSMAPRDLPVFDRPMIPSWSATGKAEFEICLEGYSGEAYREKGSTWSLPDFYRNDGNEKFIDVYLKGKGEVKWRAEVSGDWIRISVKEGLLAPGPGRSEIRLWVSVDWNRIPPGEVGRGLIRISGEGKTRRISVRARENPGKGTEAGISREMNGYVSIWAENFNRLPGEGWVVLDHLGYTGAVLAVRRELFKDGRGMPPGTGADYDFYTETAGECRVKVYCIPVHPLDNTRELRLALSLDGGKERILNFRTRGRSEQWKQNVLANSYGLSEEFKLSSAGLHTLRLRALDPCLMVDRLEVDLGGLQKAYSAVPETRIMNEPESVHR